MLKLAKIFSNGMIIQQGKEVAVWGEAEPGAEVDILVQGIARKTVADEIGAWQIWLAPMSASFQETMVVKSGEETITVEDVAVGEVWIAGGQSNMEFPLRYEKHSAKELKTVNTSLRFYDVPEKFYEEQDQDFDYTNVGIWRKAEGDSLSYFSAVGYYFQKELAELLSVPVGIVGCNWGGTRSCAWMKEETVGQVGHPWVEEWEKATAGMDMDLYWVEQRTNFQSNAGNPNTDPFSAFILPQTPSEEELFEYFKPMIRNMGENPGDGNDNILEKMASYQTALDAKTKPGILFHNMVEKIAPYTARGFIWYQGESDDVPGLQILYADMMEGLINDWRGAWEDTGMLFLQVQLPGWRTWMMQSNHDYTSIRRCQEEVTKRVQGVYMASISDVGEELDVHPKDKRTVGHRLALLARRYAYGEELLCEAPRPERVERKKKEIRIIFRYAGTALKLTGKHVEALKVTADGDEIAYTERIQGKELIITLKSDTIAAVEIAFAQEAWYRVNLYNEEGIPAIPFCFSCQEDEELALS